MEAFLVGLLVGGVVVYLVMRWFNRRLGAAMFYHFMFFLSSKNYVEDIPEHLDSCNEFEKRVFKSFLEKFRKDNPEIEKFIK
jgi:hypothetical protein